MDQELEEIKIAYLEARDAGEAPSLDEVIARHPQYRRQLVDFVATLDELDRGLDGVPEPEEPAASTRELRERVVREACRIGTLREVLAEGRLSREQVAAATNLPVSFLIRVERGRLIPGGPESEAAVDPRFLTRLGQVLRRTGDEVLEILQETFVAPAPAPQAVHLRATGQPGGGSRPVPQGFRELLAGCEDLTRAQRREWLGANQAR